MANGMMTSTGATADTRPVGDELAPELPPEQIRDNLWEWYVNNISEFPMEIQTQIAEFLGVSIEDIPNFDIQGASAAQIAQLAAYRDAVTSVDNWDELEEWEKDRALLEAGLSDIYGTGGQEPTENDTPTFEEELGENPQPDLPDPTKPEVPIEVGVPDYVAPDPEDPTVEDENPLQEAIDAAQEQFPTFEDLWEKIYEQLPDLYDPQEVAKVISTILDATGTYSVEDISTILAGGYGVIWDPATGVWTDPGSGNVFVPGLPVGLPPSSTIIGTIEDLVTDPIGTITDKIESVLGDIVSDPGGFIEGILTGALEVPVDIWDMILGGVAIGQDLYDWLIENGVETVEETTPEPPLGGEEEEPEPAVPEEAESFDRVEQTESLLGDMTAAFGDTTAEEDSFVNVEDQDQYGFPGAQTAEEDIVGDDPATESPLSAEEQRENNLTDLISGFDSNDSDLTFGGGTRLEEIGSDPPISQQPPELSGGGGGGGSGSGGSGGKSGDPFQAQVKYVSPVVQPIIRQQGGMFTVAPQMQMPSYDMGLQVTNGLFGKFLV